MRKILFSIAALLLAAGCNSKVSFTIDNPTDATLTLQIDQTAHEIGAQQSKDIALEAGEHSMDAPATGKIKFIVYAERKGGLINPTLSDFVIVGEAYVTDESKLKNFRPGGGGPFQLDGVTFDGPFQLANGLFIDKDWRFVVREPFPNSLSGYDPGSGGNIFRKIFTASDFVRYFEKQSEQAGYFEKHRQHSVPVPRKLSGPAALPDFADPQMQDASAKLRGHYQRYLKAADPAEQKQLQGEYFKLSTDFTALAASRSASQPVAENVKYNDFVRLTGNAMGISAQVTGAQGAP
jgi:hypothetical protein